MDAGISAIRSLRRKIHHKDTKVTKTDIFTGDNEGNEGIKVKELIGIQRAYGDVSPFTSPVPFAGLREIFYSSSFLCSAAARKRIPTESEKAEVIQTVLEFYVYPSGSITA
jgi:hypothetical protein